MLKDLTRSSIYKQLKDSFYYPYYLSGPKVENLFAQLWGSIKEYSKTSSKQIAIDLGLESKPPGLFKWLADLAAIAKLGFQGTWGFQGKLRYS